MDESGSSVLDARHRAIGSALADANVATLLVDLLTASEHADVTKAGYQRNDIQLLASRVVSATDWLGNEAVTGGLPIGYFGTGCGCAVALAAAAERPAAVSAIVACDGRPLLARPALPQVRAPTLLITGESDVALTGLNRAGLSQMFCEKYLEIVPAEHGDDVGLHSVVGRLARAWFDRYLVLPPDD
jgi:dienelactone hydrolase